jgi:ribosome-associated translation inhibitor RaiA
MQIMTTFRDMDPSPSLQAAAERWCARLEQVFDRIVSCHISIEQPHHHHARGAAFEIHVILAVPGAQLAISHQANEDAYVALADAFRAMRRRLLEHIDSQRDFSRQGGGRAAALLAGKA